MNITDLRTLLYQEIGRLEQILSESKSTTEENLKEVIDIISKPDYDRIIEELGYIKSKLKYIFEPQELDEIIGKIKETTKKLRTYQNNCNLDDLLAQEETEKMICIQNEIARKLYIVRLNIANKSKVVEKLRNYRSIANNFRNREIIDDTQIEQIKKLLELKNIEEKDQIILLEKIKISNVHNKATQENKKLYNESQLYEILDMLRFGYEKNDAILIEDKEDRQLVESYKKSYINVLEECTIEELQENLIDSFPNLKDKKFSYEVFYYTMIEILNYFQQKMFEASELIKERVIYDDTRTKRENKEFYYTALDKYLFLRDYFYKEIDEYNEMLLEDEDSENPNINNTYYLISANESYIEKDMKNLPEEYLEKVKILINKLKKDQLARDEIKQLESNLKTNKPLELRDDQVRIVFYHLKDNNYLIVGCTTKKSDNDKRFYDKMFDRIKRVSKKQEDEIIDDNNTKEETEIRIDKYIKDNQRKGIR